MAPLRGLLVLDFSTLLPGPLTSLMLAEAGARVVKIERPAGGDEMRSYEPKLDGDSVNFHLLNRGKRSIALDLKAPDALDRLTPLILEADILIEQFRPGVMQRLGLHAEALRALNPRLIYCSITGWGQVGPKAHVAGHDLNYMAESGLLGLTGGFDGAPVLPPVLAADIAGGAMPAMINLLLALRERDLTGQGATLDIAMIDSLSTFAYWGLADGIHSGKWPGRGDALVTGGSPRYNIYRTADHRYIAAAPLENRFWSRFCEIINLPFDLRDRGQRADVVTREVAARIAARSSESWEAAFAGEDVCCSLVLTLKEAVELQSVRQRNLLGGPAQGMRGSHPILPVPIAPAFGTLDDNASAPKLGEYKIP